MGYVCPYIGEKEWTLWCKNRAPYKKQCAKFVPNVKFQGS